MSDIYVLVHGAWHTGAEFEPVAAHLRASGHTVFCPTLAGNRPEDDRGRVGLRDAINSLVTYLEAQDLRNVRLVAHSYGGMAAAGAADRATERIRRLVLVNAFVPLDGESLLDMAPPLHRQAFEAEAAQTGGAVTLPFPLWREAFINDADLALAKATYARLNPHPCATMVDPIELRTPLAQLPIGKSYINCRQDTVMPHSLPWHPRLSERFGLFRFVEAPGSHELLFTDPAALARAIEQAGRD